VFSFVGVGDQTDQNDPEKQIGIRQLAEFGDRAQLVCGRLALSQSACNGNETDGNVQKSFYSVSKPCQPFHPGIECRFFCHLLPLCLYTFRGV